MRGFQTKITSAFDMGLGETSCVSCGQCIAVCPTGALYEKDSTEDVLAALANPEKHVFVQVAPAVRAALGEEFGYPIGTGVQGKLAAALRRIGFEKVFDTNFSADLTIMEEATEFLHRVQNGGVLPLITSCSPGWIKYCEHYFPDMTENLSSCKSPQQMFGAILKTYYAEKNGLDPKDIVCVSVMPCTAKKFEIGRDNQAAAGVPDVDISITTRELARLIRRLGLNFRNLPEEEFDSPLGSGTGAAVIFGATGGVMEAALRTAVWKASCERFTYAYTNPICGRAKFIHTYSCDGNPLPSFEGEPKTLELPNVSIDELTDLIWTNLNEDNKVSLFVRYIDLASGESETRIINKNA